MISVATEKYVGQSLDSCNLKCDRVLEHSNVSGVHKDALARIQIVVDYLSGKLNPRSAVSFKPLELLDPDADLVELEEPAELEELFELVEELEGDCVLDPEEFEGAAEMFPPLVTTPCPYP